MAHSKLVAFASMAVLSMAAVTIPAGATPQLVKQAKDAGFPAQNCQYCHTVAVPKKEGFKPEELNERGKWLLTEKDQQKAKEVKAEWLKNYPGK
jgi:hypothetical protein